MLFLSRRATIEAVSRFPAGEKVLIPRNFNGKNLARLTLGPDFKRTTTDFAIGGKTLGSDAGIDLQFVILAAKRALDGFACLHTIDCWMGK
jgi:hypothetical protein